MRHEEGDVGATSYRSGADDVNAERVGSNRASSEIHDISSIYMEDYYSNGLPETTRIWLCGTSQNRNRNQKCFDGKGLHCDARVWNRLLKGQVDVINWKLGNFITKSATRRILNTLVYTCSTSYIVLVGIWHAQYSNVWCQLRHIPDGVHTTAVLIRNEPPRMKLQLNESSQFQALGDRHELNVM